MKIIDVFWTPQVNQYKILCDCGYTFPHRADRWRIVCPKCKRNTNKDKIPIDIKGDRKCLDNSP